VGVSDGSACLHRDTRPNPPFAPHQIPSCSHTVSCPFARDGFVEDEVCTICENLAPLVLPAHNSDCDGSVVVRRISCQSDQFDCGGFVLTIDQKSIEMAVFESG